MTMPLEDQLKLKHHHIKELSDEIPGEFARKIKLYGEAQTIIGKLLAAATYDHGLRKSETKVVWGKAMVETQGTEAVKKGMAEVLCAPNREVEAKAKSEVTEWRNTYNSYGEIIQAMKLELRVMMDEMGGKGQ